MRWEIGLVLGLLLLVGCGGLDNGTIPPTVASPVNVAVSTSTAPATTPSLADTPDGPTMPTIALPPQLPTAVATDTRALRATATGLDLTQEPSITPTATEPPPTFTPPPPPPLDSADHLVFGRPVPESAPQWTDKAYPYGSTRGGTLQPHHGVEFAVSNGTPVLAAAGGIVRVAGPDDQIVYGPQTDFYGNVVIVEHDTLPSGLPLFTLYGHLSEVQVNVGQQVVAGEQLGLSGDSGVAYGPHLHFEVREGMNNYMSTRNPLLWLRPFGGTGIVAAQVTFANGLPAYEAPVTVFRVDGLAPYTASTSYAQGSINGDPMWNENFAVDDVVAGYYKVTAGTGRSATTENLWVYPGRTNFITLTLQ